MSCVDSLLCDLARTMEDSESSDCTIFCQGREELRISCSDLGVNLIFRLAANHSRMA